MIFRKRGTATSKGPAISAAVQTKLVDTLFEQQSSLIISTATIVAVSLLCYARTGRTGLLAVPLLAIALLVFRLRLAKAYHRRAASDDPMVWAYWFMVGSGATGLGWGLASSASVLQPDRFLEMLVITCQGGYVTVSAVRNNAVPLAAQIQAVLPLGLLFITDLATAEPYHMIYSAFVAAHLIAALEITRFLSSRTRDLLVAQENAATAMEKLAHANAKLEMMATTDALTGAINRRGFDMALATGGARARREGTALSLLLLDIDYFKVLNDAFGHQAGDICLSRLAACIKEAVLRPGDTVARYGGEEFAVLLADTDLDGAAEVAERVRSAVEALAIPHPGSTWRVVTVSVGCATLARGATADAPTLIKAADEALYRAKTNGRNMVEQAALVAVPDPATPFLKKMKPFPIENFSDA